MLNETIEKKLNSQINAELFSAYLYYSMANYFESISLPGAAHWMRNQVMEELIHVQKFVAYVNERRGTVKLEAIEGPQIEWKSPLDAFEAAYEHEIHITGLINKLLDAALKVSDHATANFLQWFVAEQVEEETSADAIVQQLKMVGDSKGGLFMIDKELAGRTVTLPPELSGGA
jgi:ferritin